MSPSVSMHLINLVVCAATLAVIAAQAKINRRMIWSVPTVVWIVHAALFAINYILDSQFGWVDPLKYNEWSRGLQLHGYLTALLLETARLRRMQKYGT
jgi:energy-coupling factor transporter transmembrane protein EcfT